MSELDWSQWPNFSERDMKCSETGECKMDVHFMNRLQGLRREVSRPMRVTSGYRSPDHSIEAAKPSPGSHAMGHAVDIQVNNGSDRFRLIEAAMKMGFTGIGAGKQFVHLDDLQGRETAPRPSLWVY